MSIWINFIDGGYKVHRAEFYPLRRLEPKYSWALEGIQAEVGS